ncbi:UDP-2,4-diacetamido-2,4,6-trideoxy-beta-L-altropyranose hydrolase [Castellaniella ginsengisoli]
MKIVFRTDASLEIGTGHVMRCLTLAEALSEHGAVCQFICRTHQGNMVDLIRRKGYEVHALPEIFPKEVESYFVVGSEEMVGPGLVHSHWLGASQAQDVAACIPILTSIQPHWMIVDHYALDVKWERALGLYYRKLMVIDDLADRVHNCDLLLDQNLGRLGVDYAELVPAHATKLIGPSYALLRPEFSQWRPYSLQRRAEYSGLRHLLITMGGVDKDNVTGQVLQTIASKPLANDVRITVVMGANAPWLDHVRSLAAVMPHPTEVVCGISNMAQLMADSDLVIGAAGATAWERCCLGVPTVMLVLADNQRGIGQALSAVRAAYLVDATALDSGLLITQELVEPRNIVGMSEAAAAVTDGLGVTRVVDSLIEGVRYEN